ncbi:MAG: NADH-quinone oxidoreductase subunit F, partial [Myxococcota bacterium]|nr:NADH-quinone oxidoreductase subunit F [Myxococcota bacterium]
MQKLFTRCLELDRPWDLDVYVGEQQGYRALRKALGMSSDEVVAEVLGASLRGRGGAGFSTGMKWGFLKKARPDLPHYLVINADEGEPGTFKDRLIMEYDPHRLVEGIICSCYALDCHTSYIFVRGELELAIRRLNTAIAQAREAGWLGESVGGSGFALEIYVHPGAGAYICGEETALLECLEGKPGQPRMKPPFPANVGLFGCPTIINNVETIACVPSILNDGAEGFASFGSPKNGGIKLYGLSGHVRRPGMYEARHGIHLRELIFGEDYGQGVREDRALKAVIPGGSSCPILMPDEIDVAMDFDALR